MIESHQTTVMWNVDNLNVSHKDPYKITKFASYISNIYGEKLTVKRGKVHDYLGMELDYSEEGSVKVYMIKYTGKILRYLPEKIVGSEASPAAEHLSKVRDEKGAKYLPEEQAKCFHHTTSQLLFMRSRAHRDIQTEVAFIKKRDKHPDEDE